MKRLLTIFLLANLGVVLFNPAMVISEEEAHPLINEFMASNTTTIQDEDGDYPDWIELYNPDNSPVDITGYGLSDKPDNPYKWVFPSITLEPKQHLLVFASGNDRTSIENLHTNFKINSDGETLVLTDNSGVLCDSVYTGIVTADISCGRKSDGSNEWVLFADPTPGSANISEGFSGYADSVDMSIPEGFYSGSIAVELTVASTTAEIHYTLDGTVPVISSPVYLEELSINTTTVLRARAFEEGKLPGPVMTATYIMNAFHPSTEIPEYFITCNRKDFNYIYKNYSGDTYIPVTVTYQGRLWSDVRMRIRGDDSRALPKKSLKLKFSTECFANNRDVLNFNAEYLDKSYMSQYISSRLMREAGHPAYESEFARLYLNGEFLGLYLRIENVDEQFLEANNLDPEGNLYKATITDACLSIYDNPDSVWEKKTNTEEGIEDLISLIDMINSIPAEQYLEFARGNFDYEKMVNIIALNMLVANGSTYYHNYFMYHDIHGSEKWTMIPWDMDKSLGYHYGVDFPYQRSSPSRRSDNPFHKRAILNEIILQDIRERIDELSKTIFNKEYLYTIIDSLQTVLMSSVLEDENDNVSTISEWFDEINDRKSFVENRYDRLVAQFDNLPRPFRVNPTPERLVENPKLMWHPSYDPNGDPVTYILKYSKRKDLYSDVTVVSGITDTTYTFSFQLPAGTYYWKIAATDGTEMPPWYDQSNWCEGFNSRNVFTITNGSRISTEIYGEMVLSKSLSPYIVTSDITVSVGGTLTVEPGVELIISEAVSIYVYGSLYMNGSSDEPIIIRPASDSFRWGALCFENTAETSSLSHVIISGASSGNDPMKFKSAVSGYASTIELDTVRFDNNLHCVFVNKGMVTVRNCLFSDTNKKQHVDVINAGAVVENSEFYNILEGDAVDYNGVHNGIVRNNFIVTSYDDAIDIGDGSANIIISNNRIFDCADKGISIGESSYNINIVGNIVANASIGVAVKDSSIVTLDHNTLYNNDRAVAAYHQSSDIPFGGIVFITNTIMAQSRTAAITADELSSVTVSYSLADTEFLPGTENVYSNPKFNSPEDNDFSLQPDSPAIDAGDPESNLDLDGSRVDIGALTYSIGFIPLVINEINYNSSNEFDPGDWVELYNPNNIPVDISGWIFRDEDDSHTFVLPENSFVQSNSFIVLCRDVSLFTNVFPEVKNYIGDLGFGLGGGGELIRLLNDQGDLVDLLTYDDTSPWPVEPDGTGQTLALMDPIRDNSLPEYWTASAEHGTPGEKNDVYSGVDEDAEIDVPIAFSLGQNYPNPFNSLTTIPFSVPVSGRVIIEVYSILGQRVAKIIDENMTPGQYNVVFKPDELASGLYIYTIKAGKCNKTRQMVLIK